MQHWRMPYIEQRVNAFTSNRLSIRSNLRNIFV